MQKGKKSCKKVRKHAKKGKKIRPHGDNEKKYLFNLTLYQTYKMEI